MDGSPDLYLTSENGEKASIEHAVLVMSNEVNHCSVEPFERELYTLHPDYQCI